jgi:glycosyltransferase involved in cell wall biosynthesis
LILRGADVFVLPSNFEGMPVAAMEALAHGCAVVASDSAGVEEYASATAARGCLWIYPRGEISAAVAAILAAGQIDKGARRVRARAFAVSEFSIDTCMDRYAELVERVRCTPSQDRIDLGSLRLARALSHGVAVLRRRRQQLTARYARS